MVPVYAGKVTRDIIRPTASRRPAWKTLLVLLALGGVLLALSSGPADAATTFTVNRTGDQNDLDFPGGVFDGTSDGTCDTSSTSGNQCTLRAAIQEANVTSGADTINFNIGGTTSVKTINVGSTGNGALPIIRDPVTIDGYTQQDAEENTLPEGNDAELKIQLNGEDAVQPGGASGLEIRASNSTIKGLVINRFNAHGIIIRGSGATGNFIEGNFIGTNVAGTEDRGNNAAGVVILFAPNNIIGGTQPAQRNVISGNTGGSGGGFGGVHISADGATGNRVEGNFIGTTADGTGDLGNGGDGVLIISQLINGVQANVPNNTVGGTASGAGNVISGNGGDGVSISGSGAEFNKVEGNRIGTKADGTGDLGNGESPVPADGVFISRAPNNTIGGTASGAGNRISGNGDDGVTISGSGAEDNKLEGNRISGNSNDGVSIAASNNTIGGTSTDARNHITANGDDGVEINDTFGFEATGNSILFNSIYSNTGLGIDLVGTDGVTANDNKDLDTGANNLQNFPVITSAIKSDATGVTTISGTIHSNTNQTFTIQCFVAVPDPSGHGEARTLVGQTTPVTTNFNGNASFSCPDSSIRAGLRVTATATNTATGDTSEFSRNRSVVSGP
jgi:CSLREA domain-containing protein